MTTPDPKTPGQTPADQTPAGESEVGDAGTGKGAWGAVARLLFLQLLTVVAVTAVITGIYVLAGGHKGNQVAAGSSAPATTASATAGGNQPASTPPASPSASPATSTAAPPSPTTSHPPPASAKRLKVDVFNESAPNGIAARTAARVRALGWTVGRVSNFRGTVSATTVYYPTGQAKAARELAAGLPGKPRVFPRFSTLASNRLTIIVTR